MSVAENRGREKKIDWVERHLDRDYLSKRDRETQKRWGREIEISAKLDICVEGWV